MLTCAVTVIWARRKVFLYECYFHRSGKDVPVLCSRQHNYGGVHRPRRPPRPDHDGDPRRRQRLSRPARGHDHRCYVPRRRHRHGRAARDEGIDPRGKHRSNRWLDRRIGRCRRDLHHPGVRDFRCLASLRLPACLSQVVDPDARRRCTRHFVRHAVTPRHGRGPRTSLPGISRRLANPHCRTARQPRREDPLRQHGIRRLGLSAWTVQPVQPQQRFLRQRGRAGQELRAHGTFSRRPKAQRRCRDDVLRPRHQSCVSRRWLHHRSASRGAELLRGA